ncbi:MAG: glycosyltransferase [Candidatus Curtissbacteria bacterium]|nr:glycosyltransferase [Candidatus Curtissbacteria bacterium]
MATNFSILTPVYVHNQDRLAQLVRCIDSVKNQTYSVAGSQEGLFEHIVVDDGSPVPINNLEDIQKACPHLVYQKNDAHLERLNAYHDAFQKITKDWIVFLDSDDMLSPYALSLYAKVIEENPDHKMFNFGCIYVHKDGRITHRGPFAPAKLEVGHEVFGKGQIVNGTFIFHRSVYEELGGFPHGVITPEDQDEMEKIYKRQGELSSCSPWDFSCYAQLEFIELRQFCMVSVDEQETKIIQEMGNPWGNDFYLFFKYTRKFHSLPLNLYLYFVFPK